MAHFALLWKARTIEKCRLKYEQEKLNSIRISGSQIQKQTFYQKFSQYNFAVKRCSKVFRKFNPEGSRLHNFCVCLRTDQTFPNFVMKSVIGFVGGIILTYLCFIFFVFQLSISLVHATIMSSIIGVLLTVGLAFSYRIRCLVFLLLPQFFSRVGRYTLTSYALVLILTGPATNTLKNSEVLSESMACGQEQIKSSVHQLNASTKSPYNAVKDSIKLMMDRLSQIAAQLKETLLKINRLVLNIENILQSSFAWLSSVSEACNKKLGTPYNHCIMVLHDAVLECQSFYGPRYSWLCNTGYITNVLCWTVKPLETFCGAAEFVNARVVGGVKRRMKTYADRMNSMLNVKVHIHHSYSFSSNASRSASQIAAGIVTEIRNRADPLLTWLSWSSCLTSLFLLLIIFRAKYYQHMFETRSRFDNRYITKEIRDLDLKRLKQGRETVLPLNRREKAKYIKTTSFRLVSSERVHLTRSAVFMVITTFKLMVHMVADYSLYWVLMTIRYHGRRQTAIQRSPDLGVRILDSGFVARLLNAILDAVSLPLALSSPSPAHCLPNPNPPDLQRYSQIGILIFLLWFFALFEPYGLRLRHVIMGMYRPERAKARAVWLYNHIQRTRGGFMKFARRKLHREFKYSTEEKHTFQNWLNSHLLCSCLQYLLGTRPDEPHCLLCGTIEYPNDNDTRLVRCDISNCPGNYCTTCFSEIGNLCTICLSPADYGDLSDVSLEKGSSAESSESEHDFDTDDKPPDDPDGGMSFDTSHLNKSDDSEDERKPLNNTKWRLFSWKTNTKSQENIPLLHRTNEEYYKTPNNTNICSKAMLIRHKKYIRDSENFCIASEKTNSIHTDAASCRYCQYQINICEKCTQHISKGHKILKFAMQKSQNTQNLTKPRYVKNGKPTLKIIQLVSSLSDHFKKLKKYSLKRKSNTLRIILKHQKRSNLNSIQLKIEGRRKSSKYSKVRIRRGLIFDCFGIKDFKRIEYVRQNVATIDGPSKTFRFISDTNLKRKMYRKRKVVIPQVPLYVRNHGIKENSNKNGKKTPKKEVALGICCDNNPKAKPFKLNVDTVENSEDISYRRQDNNPPKGSDSSTFCYYIGKLRSFLIDYWMNSKFNYRHKDKYLLKYFRKSDFPLKHETINHKRRKKDSNERLQRRYENNRKINEDTRKYRISTYLSDQDWIKRQCNRKTHFNTNKFIEIKDEIRPSLTKLSPKIRNPKEADQMEIRKHESDLNINRSNESNQQKHFRREQDISHRAGMKQKLQTQVLPSTLSVSATCMDKLVNTPNNSTLRNLRRTSYSSESLDYANNNRMARTFKFYRSLGHRYFDDNVDEFICDLYKHNKDYAIKPNKPKPSTSYQASLPQFRNRNLYHNDGNLPVASKTDKIFCELFNEHSTVPRVTSHNKISNGGDILPSNIKKSNIPQLPSILPESTRNIGKIREPIEEEYSDTFGYLNPITILKYLLSCQCQKIGKTKRTTMSHEKKTEDIEINPVIKEEIKINAVVQPCAYPRNSEKPTFEDRNTQYVLTKNAAQSISHDHVHGINAAVDAKINTCTCATQYISLSKDVSTYFKLRIKRTPSRNENVKHKDASTIYHNALSKAKFSKDASTMHYNCSKGTHSCAIQCNRKIKGINTSGPKQHKPKGVTVTYSSKNINDNAGEKHTRATHVIRLQKDPVSSIETIYSYTSFKSDEGTKTDTTICSLATIDYTDDTKRKSKRRKVSVVTKANQSTVTDRKVFHDASTVTSDWWSPIVERKQKQITLERKQGDCIVKDWKAREGKLRKNRKILTDGRVVKFRSRAQIIPAGTNDILSPSRYLLESQKYYNELFTPQFYAPHVFAITSVQPPANPSGKDYQHHSRKGHRPKRLEECYSPRKLNPSNFDGKWTAKSRNRMSRNTIKNFRNSRKQKDKERMLSLKRGEPSARASASIDDISMTCHCPSVGTTASY